MRAAAAARIILPQTRTSHSPRGLFSTHIAPAACCAIIINRGSPAQLLRLHVLVHQKTAHQARSLVSRGFLGGRRARPYMARTPFSATKSVGQITFVKARIF